MKQLKKLLPILTLLNEYADFLHVLLIWDRVHEAGINLQDLTVVLKILRDEGLITSHVSGYKITLKGKSFLEEYKENTSLSFTDAAVQ